MPFDHLEKLLNLGAGVAVALLAVVVVVALLFLRRFQVGALVAAGKKPKALPKHRVAANEIDSRWEESNYQKMLESVYQEIHQALRSCDKESLEVFCQGQALASFRSQLKDPVAGEDQREVLQGSVRQSWDPSTHRLVVVLAVTRWVKGWRRFYEEWTLQRQGAAWFLLERKPTKL